MAEGRMSSHAADELGLPIPRPAPPEAVREEMGRILASHEFRSSRRCQDFLRYVVEATLVGKSDQLKERTIGIEVFGRAVSYEPSDDATVRVKAGEVRKRLGLYYANEGREHELRIDLPPGAYVPDFRLIDLKIPAAGSPVARTVATRLGESKSRYSALRVTLFSLLIVGVAGLIYDAHSYWRPSSVLDQFWEPLLKQTSLPVVLSAAYVPVYAVSHNPTPEHPARLEDFTLLTDQFVGGGDLIAIADLSSMLHRMHRPYVVKVGTEASFSDMRTSPTVLIGYSYTRWKEISKEMRFFIDADRRPLMVLDNGKPTNWGLPNLPPDKRTAEDYAIITRTFHPDTQMMLVELAGITQYGTAAAAELVSKADLLRDALKSAPPDWQKKNLQIVIHTKVIAGTAASPRVLTAYFF